MKPDVRALLRISAAGPPCPSCEPGCGAPGLDGWKCSCGCHCAHHEQIHTPTLEALEREGAIVRRGWCRHGQRAWLLSEAGRERLALAGVQRPTVRQARRAIGAPRVETRHTVTPRGRVSLAEGAARLLAAVKGRG